MLEHLLRDVTGNVHDGLVAHSALGQLRNEGVAVVVPAARYPGVFAEVAPCRLQRRDMACGIAGRWLPEWKDIPLSSDLSELVFVPDDVIGEDGEDLQVQRNGVAFATLGLGAANGQKLLCEVDLHPTPGLDLRSRIPALRASVSAK